MKKVVAIALVAVMVVGCSFSAWAEVTVPDNPAGTTVSEIKSGEVMEKNNGTVTTNNGVIGKDYGEMCVGGNFGTVGTNNGTIYANDETVETNANGGVIKSNFGKVTTNEADGIVDTNAKGGTVETNNGTVKNNKGVVTTNNDSVMTNNSGAKITTNNGYVSANEKGGTVEENFKIVHTNNGTVTTNEVGGKVETNNGYIKKNEGTVDENGKTTSATVEKNALTGVVTNATNGKVYNNYGKVENATIDTDGKSLVYDNGKTLCALTYGENPTDVSLTVYSNTQMECNTDNPRSITVLTADAAGANKSGYKFVSWKANTSEGSTDATAYVGGETYTISMPVWFEAIWEKLPEEEKKAIVNSGGATFTATPTSQGASSAPITSGSWAQASNGKYTYTNNGQKLINCTAWIQYTDASGQVVTGKFCFDNSGYALVNTWKQVSDGVWNYFGADGKMVTNTTTPDGYVVDANGEWRK